MAIFLSSYFSGTDFIFIHVFTELRTKIIQPMLINLVVGSMSDQGRQVQSRKEKFNMVICAFRSRGWGPFLQYERQNLRFPRQDSGKGGTTRSLLLCYQPEHLSISPDISTHRAWEQFTETHLDPSPNDHNRRGCKGDCQGKEVTHQCCGVVPGGWEAGNMQL